MDSRARGRLVSIATGSLAVVSTVATGVGKGVGATYNGVGKGIGGVLGAIVGIVRHLWRFVRGMVGDALPK